MEYTCDQGKKAVSRILPFKIPLLFIAFGLSLVVTALIMFLQSHQPQPEELIIQKSEDNVLLPSQRIMYIDIGGGVKNPGVYELPEGSRIQDAIKAAGGLYKADEEMTQKSINRAQKLVDGTKLYIPISIDIKNIQEQVMKEQSLNINTSHNIESMGQSMISINTASQTELETLSGVGPATAKKIIENRPYMNLDELVQKKAVGQKLFERIKNSISL